MGSQVSPSGLRLDGVYSERELFREVLIRKGFDELEGHRLRRLEYDSQVWSVASE